MLPCCGRARSVDRNSNSNSEQPTAYHGTEQPQNGTAAEPQRLNFKLLRGAARSFEPHPPIRFLCHEFMPVVSMFRGSAVLWLFSSVICFELFAVRVRVRIVLRQ